MKRIFLIILTLGLVFPHLSHAQLSAGAKQALNIAFAGGILSLVRCAIKKVEKPEDIDFEKKRLSFTHNPHPLLFIPAMIVLGVHLGIHVVDDYLLGQSEKEDKPAKKMYPAYGLLGNSLTYLKQCNDTLKPIIDWTLCAAFIGTWYAYCSTKLEK
jgi:hypothetical protein